jgi:hypothetical protein
MISLKTLISIAQRQEWLKCKLVFYPLIEMLNVHNTSVHAFKIRITTFSTIINYLISYLILSRKIKMKINSLAYLKTNSIKNRVMY